MDTIDVCQLLRKHQYNDEKMSKLIEEIGVDPVIKCKYYYTDRRKSHCHPIYPDKNVRKIFINMIINELKSKYKCYDKTNNGNTQQAERTIISQIKNVLDDMGVIYTMASSQQPYDFRVLLPVPCLIEVKKSDGKSPYFNDTLPVHYGDYIMISTKHNDIKHINGGTMNQHGSENYDIDTEYNTAYKFWDEIFNDIVIDNPIYLRALLDIIIYKTKNISNDISCYIRPTWKLKDLYKYFE